VGAELDDSLQASAQAESQSACRAEEAEERADAGEDRNRQSDAPPEATTPVDDSLDLSQEVESAPTTPKSDPCDQDTRQATGKDLGGDLTVVAKPGTADSSPSRHEPPSEEIPLRAELADPSIFDADARLWHNSRPHVAALQSLVEEDPATRRLVDRAPSGALFFTLAIDRLTRIPPPEDWIICPRCQGKGKKEFMGETDCGLCVGAGYQYR
jgi:hypothetical protein